MRTRRKLSFPHRQSLRRQRKAFLGWACRSSIGRACGMRRSLLQRGLSRRPSHVRSGRLYRFLLYAQKGKMVAPVPVLEITGETCIGTHHPYRVNMTSDQNLRPNSLIFELLRISEDVESTGISSSDFFDVVPQVREIFEYKLRAFNLIP